MAPHDSYQSYMVRIYRQKDNGRVIVRITLDQIQTGRTVEFDSVGALLAYLDRRVSPVAGGRMDSPENRDDPA